MSNLQTLATKLRKAGRLQGRLVIALDATASRSDTWHSTRKIMGSIFRRLTDLGDLQISIGYFRGLDECQFTEFTGEVADLETAMDSVGCRTGNTQIGQVLSHFVETAPERPSAFVYIGDTAEEGLDGLLAQARILATYRVPTFWFLERTPDGTRDKDAAAYKDLAQASAGVFAEFTESAADKLEELLVAAATFAIGEAKALEGKGEAAQLLLTQLKGE